MVAPVAGMAFKMAAQFMMSEVLAPDKSAPQPETAPEWKPFG